MSTTSPTPLSPWFVVQKYTPGGTRYYSSPDDIDDTKQWGETQHGAMLFMNLQSAARVATALDGEVRCLWTRDQIREFGR